MNTRRQLISFLLALFMVLGTITPLFAENDSVTVLPPRMADKTESETEPNNIVILNNDKEDKENKKEKLDSSTILENNKEDNKEESKTVKDNSPVILKNRDDNNVTILPPITNREEEIKEEIKEEVKKELKEEPKEDVRNDSKAPVEVQVLSKRDNKKPASSDTVSLVLLNDKPASVNEEVYSRIKWIKDDFNIDSDKILGLSEDGLKKVKANKKLVIPEVENITTIEKQAFMNLGLRVVEIPGNITLIEEEAFKDNGLTKVIINGKGKTIAGSAFGEEFLSEYKKSEKDVFLYEFEGLEIGEEVNPDAVGASEPDDLKYFTFNRTTITGLTNEGKAHYKEHPYMVLPGVNPEGNAITAIGDNAFEGSYNLYYLENVDFSNCKSLESIGSLAFRNNRLKFAIVPTSLKHVGYGAFEYNKKPFYIYTEDESNPNNLKPSNHDTTVFINPLDKPDSHLLYTFDGSTITGLTEAGKEYYKDHHEMKLPEESLNLELITSISDNAFNGYGITSINLDERENIVSIGSKSFANNNIRSLNILFSLSDIADDAFEGNQGSNDKNQVFIYTEDGTNPANIKNTEYHVLNPEIKADTPALYKFEGTKLRHLSKLGKKYYSEHKDMILPNKNLAGEYVTSVSSIAGYKELEIDSVDFSNVEKLEEIDSYAFGNVSPSKVIFGDNLCLKTIGSDAFRSGCFEEIDLSTLTSLEFIDNGGFVSDNLKTVKIPLSLKYLNSYAFENSSKTLVNVYTPDGTNPNNLSDTDFYIINPNMKPYNNDFYTFDGEIITGLTDKGRDYYKNHNEMILPAKTPDGKDIKGIAVNAFSGLNLIYVDLSKLSSLNSLESGVFSDNNILAVKVSKSLKEIKDDAFSNNAIKTNESKLVVLTPNASNPMNLIDRDNYVIDGDLDNSNPNFYLYNKNAIIGLSNLGQAYFETHKNMVIPEKTLNGESVEIIDKLAPDMINIKKLDSIDFSKYSELKAINEDAFNSWYGKCVIKFVNFSNCSELKTIGSHAFDGSYIESVNFKGCDSLERIENGAFNFNFIKSLDLSNLKNLKSIGSSAFSSNQELKSLNLSGCSTLESIGDNAFQDTALASIDFTGLSSLKTIGNAAFQVNGMQEEFLKSLNLLDCVNLETIGKTAFTGNKIQYAFIPLSLKKIDSNAFYDNESGNPDGKAYLFTSNFMNPNNLEDSSYHLINPDLSKLNGDELSLFNFEKYKDIFKVIYDNDMSKIEEQEVTKLIITGLSDLGKIYYKDHHNLIIPGEDVDYHSISKIAMNAFEGLGLESVDFSNAVYIETIEPGAFRNNNLSELDLDPVSWLNTIGTLAFAGNKLKSAKFPYGVQHLGYDAFKDNIGFNAEKQVFIESSNNYHLPDTEYHIFRKPYDETPVLTSDSLDFFTFDGTTITGLTDLGKENYKNNSTMVLPGVNKEGKRITAIGDNAFNGIGTLSINFGKIDSLTKIGKNAFSNNNIDRVDLRPLKDLLTIDDEAFSNSKINHIFLDKLKKLERIGKRAFADNNIANTYLDLTSNYSLNTIDEEAFKNNKLTIAKIPLNLLTLFSNAFEGNTGFKDGKVYVYTADGTNPKNLQNSDYHLINPKMEESNSSLFKYEETEDGVTLLGLSDIGEIYVKQNPDKEIVIPSKTDTGVSIARIADNAFNEKNLNLTFEENTNLTYIGDHAFFKNRIKTLDLNKLPNVSTISPYAFAHNEIKDLTISDTLATIGKYAFRDNEVEKLDTKNVKTIEEGAFSNNNLRELILGTAIEVIKDYAFKQNDLTNVEIPKTIKEFGKMVFTFNNRYVRVKTESDLIKTEKVGRAFGHVVNSVVITVRFVDKETKKKLLEDKVIGDDLTDINTGIVEGEENIYYPEEIKGYFAPKEIKFTPYGSSYVLKVEYTSLKTKPVITSSNVRMLKLNETVDENMLKSFVKVTDLTGKDISDRVEVTPKTIDTTSGGLKKVTYKVTDEYGNTAVEEMEIPVAIDWNDYPIGGGWVLGDFTYNVNDNSVTGFSAQGEEKVKTNKDLVVPGVIPVSGIDSYEKLPKIEKVADFGSFSDYQLTRIDFSNCANLTTIGSESFYGNNFTSLDLSGCANLRIIGQGAFSSNYLTSLNLYGCTNLISIGNEAFSENQLTTLDLSGCENLKDIGDEAFLENQLTSLDMFECSNLRSGSIDATSFLDNPGSPEHNNLVVIWVNKKLEGKIPSRGNYIINPKDEEISNNNFIYSDFIFNLNSDNTYRISGLSSSGKNKLIHNGFKLAINFSEYNGKAVTRIERNAFKSSKIKNLDLSKCVSLIDINANAFASNQIVSLDLSGCTNLKQIGLYAFQDNKIKSLDLSGCASLENISISAFSKNSLTELDLSRCTNLKIINDYAFGSNQITTALIPLSLKNIYSDSFGSKKSSKKVTLFTPDYTNPNNLQDSEYYVINPLMLTINAIDRKGTVLKKLDLGVVATGQVNLPNIPGYIPEYIEETGRILSSNLWTVDSNMKGKQTINVVYRRQVYENVDGLKFSSYLTPSKNSDANRYYIGEEQRINLRLNVLKDISNINNSKIFVTFPPYVDTSFVNVPKHPNIKSVNVLENQIEINLQNITNNTSMEIPVLFKLKEKETPANTDIVISGGVLDGNNKPISNITENKFSGYYNLPKILVCADNKNGYENYYIWQDGPRAVGYLSETEPIKIAEPFNYKFELIKDNLFERNISSYKVTVPLSTYKNDKDEDIKPVFDSSLNKGWMLEGENLVYTSNKDDVLNQGNINLPKLILSFPDAKNMADFNLKAKIVMTPENQGKNESLLIAEDDINIKLTGEGSIGGLSINASNIRYDTNKGFYIYNHELDRDRTIPWIIRYSKPRNIESYSSLTMTVDNFDERYKVTRLVNKVDEPLTYKLYSKGKLVNTFTLNNNDEYLDINEFFDKLEVITRDNCDKSVMFYIETKAKDSSKSFDLNDVKMTVSGTLNSKTASISDSYHVFPFEYELKPGIEIPNSKDKTFVSGETVLYKLNLKEYATKLRLNDEGMFSKELDNFKMIQTIPKNALIESVSLSEDFKNSDESSYEIIDLGNGERAVLFKAKKLKAGTINIGNVKTILSSGVADGLYKPTVYATWDSDYASKLNVQNVPENLKPYIGDKASISSLDLPVASVKAIFSELFIKTNNELRVNSTTRDGNIDYVLRVVNNSDREITNLILEDILPYNGDVDDSEVDVVLRGPISISNGRVLYSSSKRGMFMPEYKETYVDDATYFRIEIPRIAKNETIEISVPAKIQNLPKTLDEQLALANAKIVNSFSRTDSITDTLVKTNPVTTTYMAPLGTIKFTKYGLKKSWFSSNYKKFPLKNAEFELRDMEGNFVAKVTSDSNGLVEFKGVEVKDYIITETISPKGYDKMPDIKISKNDFKVVDGEVIYNINEDAVNESVRKGNITINKRTSNGAPLKDVEFNIKGTDSFNSNFDKNIKTNSLGVATLKGIPEGNYVVTEIEESTSRIEFISALSQTFKIEQTSGDDISEDQEVTLNFVNDKVKFRVYKIAYGEDEEIPSDLANVKTFNRTRLSDIEFEVTINGTSKTYTTNSEGYIEIESPTNTSVKIKETKGNPRFKPYNKEINLTITDDGKIEDLPMGIVYVPNIKKKLSSEVEIVKVDGEGNALRGEETSFYSKEKLVETKTSTTENSKFAILNPGTYSIKETKAPLGYYKNDKESTFTIVDDIMNANVVEENSPQYNENINKDEYEMYVATDTEVKFMKKIKLVNNKLDVKANKYERVLNNITEEEANKYKEDPNYSVIPNGQFYNVVHPLKGAEFDLFEGDKVIKKLVSDDKGNLDMSDVLWNEEKVYRIKETKTPSSKYQLLKKPIVINFEMLKRDPNFNGVVNINIENKPYKGKIIISKYRNDENEIMEGQEFTLYKDSVSEENKLMTKATDKSGLIEFSDLELGHYIIKETKVDEGWALSKDEYVSDLTVESPISVHKIFNAAKTIKFTVKKVDEKGNPMEGVLFALYNAESPYLPKTPGPKQKIIKTDEKGKIDFDYYEDYRDCMVENNNDTIKQIEHNNENGLNIVEDTEAETFGLEISNDGPDNSNPVRGNGVDGPSDGGKEQMAEYHEPQEANIHMVMESNKKGIIVFEVPYGNYILREVKTKDGYVLSQKTHLITPESEGKVYEYVNYPIEIPKTGTFGVMPFMLMGSLLVAGAYIILKKKGEKARD